MAVLALAATALAEKTDQVVLRNGDHLTGEIKGMSLGKLDFKTDDAGRPSIEWLKVARLTSVHVFEVELASHEKYYGSLLPSNTDGVLVVGDHVIPLAEVVSITPMDETFWSRVTAYLDLGFTLTKANSAVTFSGDAQFAYRSERWGAAFTSNGYFQTDQNNTLVSQYSVLLSGTYYFTRWRETLAAGADHNDELALELRLWIGALTSYALLRSQSNEIWLTGGLVGDRELYASVEPNYNVAAYLAGEWQIFRYETPKLDSNLLVNVLPVLNDWGRVRGTASYRVRYEVFRDFNVGVKFTFTYDTRPPDPTASHTDYLLALTIGWSYRR